MQNYDWNKFIGGMPWMQQGAQVPNTFSGTDANGAFQGGGDPYGASAQVITTGPDGRQYTDASMRTPYNPYPIQANPGIMDDFLRNTGPGNINYANQGQPGAKTGTIPNYAPGQIPGVGATLPSPPTYGAPGTQGPTAPGAPGSNPFLTNSAMQGIGAATQPFNSQYYDQLGQSLYGQANRNLMENVIPQIQQSGQAAGQYGGGSRNQIAQGIAMRGMNEGVFNAMAPLYAQGFESNLNRNLQGGQTAMQGLLGLGNLDIQRMNAETNAASATANAAGAPQYSNPYASGLGAMMSLLPFLSGKWGN